MIKKRKIPMRTCLGCREQKPKKEMIRVVRTPEGTVILDLTGKKSGRGAYICLQDKCLKKVMKSRSLEKNLQAQVPSDLVAEIANMIEIAPQIEYAPQDEG